MPDLQEILALAVVALVIGVGLWRRWRRRGQATTACGSNCAKPATKPKEIPLRFHRRRP